MRCPFLREAQVKSCQASTFRKQIVRTAASVGDERCVTAEYVHCAAVKELHEELPSQTRCPFLQESLVQYCSAAPVAKYVPYSDSLLSRCGNGRHSYCDLYLAVARPSSRKTKRDVSVDEVFLPDNLWFTKNHLWIDFHDDNSFQIGIDALLAQMFGEIDSVTYLPQKGISHPTAVFSVHGQDFHVAFPLLLATSGFNSNLRVNPARIVNDPYGLGWLFEGMDSRPVDQKAALSSGSLMGALAARVWAKADLQRMTSFIHECVSRPDAEGVRMLNDGGTVGKDVFKHLSREESLQFFNEFFSSYASLRS